MEVPFGLTLGEVIEEVGGGPEPGQRIKAVQTGGPSGGCLPASLFNLPLDYESLNKAGSIMGSGGMIVIDEATCLVDLILYFMRFAREESCGQCAPCRLGTARLVRILEKITLGQGCPEDLDRLAKIGWTMQEASLCGLGRTAANPVLSVLRYFREELEKHVIDKECPAGICRGLVSYRIDTGRCISCLMCLQSCPVGAIAVAEDGYPRIDQNLCTRCGTCPGVCPPGVSAIIKLKRKETPNTQKSGGE